MKKNQKPTKRLWMRALSVAVLAMWLPSALPAVNAAAEETDEGIANYLDPNSFPENFALPGAEDEGEGDPAAAGYASPEEEAAAEAALDEGGISIWQDGKRVDIDTATGEAWDEQTVTGEDTPTLKAVSPQDFIYKMSGSHIFTVPESEHLYTMTVATGMKAGSTVEYFAIRYTDENNASQTKYLFPKSFATTASNDYIKNLKKEEVHTDETVGYHIKYYDRAVGSSGQFITVTWYTNVYVSQNNVSISEYTDYNRNTRYEFNVVNTAEEAKAAALSLWQQLYYSSEKVGRVKRYDNIDSRVTIQSTNKHTASWNYTETALSNSANERHSYLSAMGYSINAPSQSKTALESWSIDELLFKTEAGIKKVNSIDVFMSNGDWTVQGISISQVSSINGYTEYGFYSGKYALSLGKRCVSRMVGKKGNLTSLNATGDTLICLGGDNSDLYTLETPTETETSHNTVDDLYTFRLDFADSLNAGLESLLRTDANVSDPTDGEIAEDLAIEIEYQDTNGWTRTVTMPVLLSVLGQYKMYGDSVRTIGLGQRGDTLAFTGYLPEFSKLLSYKLHVGSAARDRIKTTGGISGGNAHSIALLNNDYIGLAGVSIYKGTCRMSNIPDGTDPVSGETLQSYSYAYDFSSKPFQYYTVTQSSGYEINPGTSLGITLQNYTSTDDYEDPLVASDLAGNFIIRIKTDTPAGSGTTGNIRVLVTYQDYSGSEKTSLYYNSKDEVRSYMGYWPTTTDTNTNFAYDYGMTPGNYIEFPINLTDAAAISNVSLSLDNLTEDLQISGVSFSVVDEIGRRRAYKQALTAENSSSNYRMVRTLKHTVIPPFPITMRLHFAPGESYNLSTGTGTVIMQTEVDYASMRYSMSYEDTKKNLGFVRNKYTYDVTVKVADDSTVSNINGDSGSKNQFYFQLMFKNGNSAFVLANQQLYSDGFRAGKEELFSITVNRNYGDVDAIRIIPEDISEDSDVFDKLNIEKITVTERTNGGSAMQYVFDSVGWIGIDYREKSEDHAIIGRPGRMLSELARTFTVSYQEKVVNLLCEIAARAWDINYSPFDCSMSAELEYLDLDGQTQTKSFDVINRMYDYMKRTPKSYEGYMDGSNQSLYNGMGTISDPNTMLRPCHTDRFMLPPLANCKTLKSITFKVLNRTGDEAQWNIGGVWVSRIISDSGMVTLTQQKSGESEYYRSMETEPLCQLMPEEGASSDTTIKVPLLVGQTIKQTIKFSESTITWSESSSWTSAVTRLPDNTNDTLNLYVYPTAASRNINGVTVSAAIQYTLPFSKIMQVKQSYMNVYGSGTEEAMFYFTGIPANNMQTLSNVGIVCRDPSILFNYALVEQVRNGVVIATYEITLSGAAATLGLKSPPSGHVTIHDPKRQKLLISFSGKTSEATLFPPTEDYTNVNDIAVAFSYTSTLDKGYTDDKRPVYYTPYIYLTDVGINKLSPGLMAEIPFEIPYVDKILSYKVGSFGNITAEINSAMIFNYSYSGKPNANKDETTDSSEVLNNCFSINERFTVKNQLEEKFVYPNTSGMVGPNTLNLLEMNIKTAEAAADQESGTDAPVAMNIYYITSSKKQVYMPFDDIRQYIQSDNKAFATGQTAKIRLFLPDCKELTGIEIWTADEEGIATWSVESIEWSLGLAEPLSRTVNMEFNSEPQMISVRDVQLVTNVTVNGVYKGAVQNHKKGVLAQGEQPVEIKTRVERGEGFTYEVTWTVDGVPTDVTAEMTKAIEGGFIFTPDKNDSATAQIYKITISAVDNPNIQDVITVTVPVAKTPQQTEPPVQTTTVAPETQTTQETTTETVAESTEPPQTADYDQEPQG